MINKKSKWVTFTFDERSLTKLENMTQEGHFSSFSGEPLKYTEITVRHPETGEEKVIRIPALMVEK